MNSSDSKWDYEPNVDATAEKCLAIGRRFDSYMEMVKAAYALCHLAKMMKNVALHTQAEAILKQFERELRARPLFSVIDDKELN